MDGELICAAVFFGWYFLFVGGLLLWGWILDRKDKKAQAEFEVEFRALAERLSTAMERNISEMQQEIAKRSKGNTKRDS